MKFRVCSDSSRYIRFKQSFVDPKGYAKSNSEEQTKHYQRKASFYAYELTDH
jgi:hypothetical protein